MVSSRLKSVRSCAARARSIGTRWGCSRSRLRYSASSLGVLKSAPRGEARGGRPAPARPAPAGAAGRGGARAAARRARPRGDRRDGGIGQEGRLAAQRGRELLRKAAPLGFGGGGGGGGGNE